MKILNRYILRETVIFFSISLFAFTSILFTLRMLHFASLIVNKGVDASQIVGVFISIIPTFLEVAIPMATLLGVMMAFARMSGDSELIVIRASGISIFQLLTPVILFGLMAASINLYVSASLKPWGYKNLSRVLFEIARSKSTSGLTEGIFNPLGGMMLYTEKIDYQTGALTRVLIDDRRDKDNRKLIIAKAGKILSDPITQTITLLLNDGVIHEIVQNRYVLTRFNDNSLAINADDLLDPTAQKKDRSPREMTVSELRSKLAEFETALSAPEQTLVPANPGKISKTEIKKKYRRTKTEFGTRFSMPFASFVLALVALPLGILPPRTQKTWGAGLSLGLGLLVFVLYYGLLSMGVTLGENGTINSYVGVWMPNVISLLAAIYVTRRIGTEKWSSVADELSLICMRLFKRPLFLKRKEKLA